MGVPLNSKIISPAFIPPFSDGLPGETLDTNAPLGSSNFSASAISFVTSWILTPNQPLLVSPYLINWSTTCFALFEGIAKPIPIDPPWLKIAVFTPTTSPSILKSGPPELPWFIDASVWIKSSYLERPRLLFLAEIIPDVTVPPKPNGLPIARTQSPILAISEFPNFTGLKISSESIFSTAISDKGSLPIIFALYSLSPLTLTKISSASFITWLFVTTVPFLSIIKPDPKALAFLSWGVPNSLNISSKGEPGGNWKLGNGLVFVTTVVVVEIFTTDGISCSAKSAKELGVFEDIDAVLILNNTIKTKLNFKIFFIILTFKTPDYEKSN